MGTAENIKAELPDWPDEVIEEWLLRLANRADTGWPPPQDVNFHAWGPILGYRPLSWWKDVTWQLDERDVGFDALCKDTKQIAVRMVAEINKEKQATTAKHDFNAPWSIS